MTEHAPRDTYKYLFKVGDKVIYHGVTGDLQRSETDHRLRWPEGCIHKVGIRTTRWAALKWKRQWVRHDVPPGRPSVSRVTRSGKPSHVRWSNEERAALEAAAKRTGEPLITAMRRVVLAWARSESSVTSKVDD